MPGEIPDFQAGWDAAYKAGYDAGSAAAALPDVERLAAAHVLLTKWSDWAALTWQPTDRTWNSLLDATKRLLAELSSASPEADGLERARGET